MTPSPARHLWKDRAGSAAVQTALVLPILLAFLLGVAEVGRMAWTKAALTYAVQEAVRCASVRQAVCGTPEQVQAFAAERASALNIPEDAFTFTNEACGRQVAVQVTKGFILYRLLPTATPITAMACRP